MSKRTVAIRSGIPQQEKIPFLEIRFTSDIRRVYRGIEALKKFRDSVSDSAVVSLLDNALKAHGEENGEGFLQLRFKGDLQSTRAAQDILREALPLLQDDQKVKLESIISDLR